ncbi:unnamed protein product [Ambrosiozyma monospora]|uniref:Unnamed protein product n=1 Tax=Ambrosiozyma monospora TaxID=43982 RepID=A0ACB5TRV0_AMBMO|nr:unnamed protein product [Ambrosiozyma monospora]
MSDSAKPLNPPASDTLEVVGKDQASEISTTVTATPSSTSTETSTQSQAQSQSPTTEQQPDEMAKKLPQEKSTSQTETTTSSTSDQDKEQPTLDVNELSSKVKELTEENSKLKNKFTESEKQIEDLKSQLLQSRKLQQQSDEEVQKLSQEIEDLSETLFDEANNKVKEANIETHNTKVKNQRLIEALKDKEMTIEILTNQLNDLKSMINNMEEEKSATVSRRTTLDLEDADTLGDAAFKSKLLTSFNGRQVYSPIFNQLRFDLSGFISFKRAISPDGKSAANIRDSSFYKHLLSEEIEPTIRLDLSPGVRIYQRKSFVISLIEQKVTIEPLT